MICRMWRHVFHPTVSEELFLRHPHTLFELSYLLYSIVYGSIVICHYAIPCQAWHSHIHIIQPYCVVMRAMTCKYTIGKAVLFVANEVHIAVYHISICLVGICHVESAVCCCHCSTVVKSHGIEYHSHLCIIFLVFFYCLCLFQCLLGYEVQAVCSEL